MTTQQIYSSNTTRLFPLEEGDNKSELPKDLIVDMSLTLPEGVDPVITAVSVTEYIFFVAIEDRISKKAIGHLCSRYYEPYNVIQFNMTMPEAFGWLVPGPGVSNTGNYPRIEENIDKSVILTQPPTVPGAMVDLIINDIRYKADNILDIKSLNNTILIRKDRCMIDGRFTDCIRLSRNNSAFTTEEIYHAFVDNKYTEGAARSIGGAIPDKDGKILISCESNVPGSSDVFSTHIIKDHTMEDQHAEDGTDLSEIGLLFFEESELCAPYVYDNRILHGRCEQGIIYELPCDHIIEKFFHPEFAEKDCGCSEDGE